jgi:hypothetical protein
VAVVAHVVLAGVTKEQDDQVRAAVGFTAKLVKITS